MRTSSLQLPFLAFLTAIFVFAADSSITGAPKSKNAGDLFLLTVTVGTHDPKGTPNDWNYTAEELERIVKQQCGTLFHEVHGNLIKGSQATPKGVLQGFAWLRDNVKEQDRVLIYIGSHGGSDAKRGFCLFANDGVVYGDEIKPALANVKGRVVLVIQACHSGDLLVKHRKELEVMPRNVAAVSACREGQTSHGIMLPPIMEALYGWSDADADGTVSVAEFLHYIKYRIGTFYPEEWAQTQQAVTVEPKDFDLSIPLAKSVPPKELGKQIVMIEYKTDWFGGVVFPKKDPSHKHQHWVHFFGLKPGDEDWVENGRICPHGFEPVIVKSGDKWYTAALLKQEGDRFHIRYIGVMDNKEETVSRNMIDAFSLAARTE